MSSCISIKFYNFCFFFYLYFSWYFIGRLYKSKKNLKGKVIIVTGGNCGIGFETCKELSGKYQATVILASRNSDKGRLAVFEIQKKFPNADIRFEHLDLSSFFSVCTFVKKISEAFPKVDAIVNNAGVFYHPPTLTKDGFETTFQTNFLSPFLLTTNLLPFLNKDRAKIINVASQAQDYVTEFPQGDYHLLYPDASVARFESYFYSKFCLVLWSAKLANLLRTSNNNKLSIHCVDPGNVETNIFRHFPPLSTPVWYYLQKPIRIWCIKTPKEGAQSILYALLEDEPIAFYIKHQKQSNYNPLCDNQKYQDQLWHISQQYCSSWIN